MVPPRGSLMQQSPQPVAVSSDGSKGGKTARRRKSKQQQQQQQQQEHLPTPQKVSGNLRNGATEPASESATTAGHKEPLQPLLAASERTPTKQQVVAASGPVNEEKPRRAVPAVAVPITELTPFSKQQSTDEADEIDAGIELDGSSNSGSSVKDITDDQQQLKSNSVSPVMAQSSVVVEVVATNETTNYELVKTNSLPTSSATTTAASKPNEALLCAALGPAKKVSTKQQLAANQQVMDADEQLLQEKLQSKQQRKSSLDTLASTDAGAQQQEQVASTTTTTTTTSSTTATDTKQAPVPVGRTNVKSANGAHLKRRFSSQGSQERGPDSNPSAAGPAASLCKICNQHVYQMERMMAEKFVYHKRCFRCHQCNQQLLISSYSSHEGRVYCKLHHRQLFQPQVKLDNEDDVDIVAKSRIRKRQMIICENKPAELPKDVVRSDTKVDDGIDQLNLNLNNILEKFERATAEGSQPSTAGSTIIEKPSFNIKKTLMAFERQVSLNGDEEDDRDSTGVRNNSTTSSQVEKPVVRKLTNLNGFLNRQNSQDGSQEISLVPSQQRPFAVKRSESLMMRLKKYESRIAGEQVDDDDDDDDEEDADKDGAEKDENNNSCKLDNKSVSSRRNIIKTERLPSFDLSSLKNQWERGDISKVRRGNEDDTVDGPKNNDLGICRFRSITTTATTTLATDEITSDETNYPGSTEKDEELLRVRHELAQRKLGDSAASVRNIYENAIKEAELQQKQQQASARRDLTDLAALNGISANKIIQKQFLMQSSQPDDADAAGDNTHSNNQSNNTNGVSSPPVKGGRFQLNLSNRANKLKERFELGLIKNSSQDDSDLSDQEAPELSRLEQIKREKLEDLSVFTEGEIKAREARSLFQQIDRRISQEVSNGEGSRSSPRNSLVVGSRSLAAIGASMQAKLTSQMNNNNNNNNTSTNNNNNINNNSGDIKREDNLRQQPIRLTNNVRT